MTILVLGAGIVGLSVAYELASRGANVHVIDPRGIGCGATRASAGILAPHIEGHHQPLLDLALGSLDLFDDFVERVRADSGRQVEFERSGTLQVAVDEREAVELESASRSLARAGVEHVLAGREEARTLEPAIGERAVAALLVPAHGYVAVTPLAAALADAGLTRGVTFSSTRALGVEIAADRVAVTTPEGVMSADAVIVAAGSWSSQIGIGAPHRHVKPIRGQLLHLRVESRPASRVIWSTGCYIVPRRDASVLVGATVEDVGFDEGATVAGVQHLLNAATELLPALRSARFEDVLVGLRPMLADQLPAIGRSSTMPHVFYAIGHYRNGVLLAPLTAQLMADLVVDGREHPELALVGPDRLGL